MKQTLLRFGVADVRVRAHADRGAVAPPPPRLCQKRRRDALSPGLEPPRVAVWGARATSAEWPEVIEIDCDDTDSEHASFHPETDAAARGVDGRRSHVSGRPNGANVKTDTYSKNRTELLPLERQNQVQLSVPDAETATNAAQSTRSPGLSDKQIATAGVPGSHAKPVARGISLSPSDGVTAAAGGTERCDSGPHSRGARAANGEVERKVPLKSVKGSRSPSASSSTSSSSQSSSSAWSAGTIVPEPRKGPRISTEARALPLSRQNTASQAVRGATAVAKASVKKALAGRAVPYAALCAPATTRQDEQQHLRQQQSPQLDDDIPESLRYKPPPLYSWKEFEDMVYYIAQHRLTFGKYVGDRDPLEAIELGICSKANNKLEDKYNHQFQQKAQYGRVLFQAIDKLFGPELFNLTKTDTFMDLGHGTGLIVLQAAFTVGCSAVGIELDSGRFAVSECFYDAFHRELPYIQNRALEHRQHEPTPQGGKVSFIMGSFSHAGHRGVLTNQGGITKCFVNNFNGVFGDRSKNTTRGSLYYLNDFIAALFAQMEPGSIMITLDTLELGISLEEANKVRKMNGLKYHDKASFYTMETHSLGAQKDTVSWSDGGGCETPVTVYKYTRVGEGKSKFVCCNKGCPLNQEVQDAVELRLENGQVPTEQHIRHQDDLMVIRTCRDCNITNRSIRKRNAPQNN